MNEHKPRACGLSLSRHTANEPSECRSSSRALGCHSNGRESGTAGRCDSTSPQWRGSHTATGYAAGGRITPAGRGSPPLGAAGALNGWGSVNSQAHRARVPAGHFGLKATRGQTGIDRALQVIASRRSWHCLRNTEPNINCQRQADRRRAPLRRFAQARPRGGLSPSAPDFDSGMGADVNARIWRLGKTSISTSPVALSAGGGGDSGRPETCRRAVMSGHRDGGSTPPWSTSKGNEATT